MASKFRLNRYNWLGHKLLTQGKYERVLQLEQHLANNIRINNHEASGDSQRQQQQQPVIERRPVSEHMVYLSCLALMQTSTRLDEVIYSIQQLNFETNNQYFLLLCQCLLYLGNHESVIALCERIITKEVNKGLSIAPASADAGAATHVEPFGGTGAASAASFATIEGGDESPLIDGQFKKLFERVGRNHLVTEPRLWFILGLCLEFRNRPKDALLAYKVSSNLAMGNNNNTRSSSSALDGGGGSGASLNNFHEPHLRYAQSCIRFRNDFKRANQVLARAASIFPQNYTLNPLLSLIICSAAQSGLNQFSQADELLIALENYSACNRNPSSSYNSLALRCRQKAAAQTTSSQARSITQANVDISDSSDDNKFRLRYLLIKVHLTINNLVQDSKGLFALVGGQNCSAYQLSVDKQADKLIDLMRNSDVSCWQSSSIWNNLAVCYLIKGKLIASLSCLMKAEQSEPLDWRLCYNMALACLQAGLVARALFSLIAARHLYTRSSSRAGKQTSTVIQMIGTLMAICYEKLGQIDEARRFHIEATQTQKVSKVGVLVLSIINYLVFLHNSSESNDPQTVKLKLHLLDQLEQSWLQRNQNDSQFNKHLLDIARRIGEDINNQSKTGTRKAYAWTKVDESRAPQSVIII